jgi:hypothetical protein
MADPDINVTIDEADPPIGTTWSLDPALKITLSAPEPDINVTINPDPAINVVVYADAPPIFTELNIIESFVPGPPGPPGPRGSLFLGGYPSFGNLPVPDGINIKVGDFALVQDESAIYELE